MISEFKGDFIQWLRGFYHLAMSPDVSGAMQEMNRTQSALAYQIRSLEKVCGVRLFRMQGGRRCLTSEGRIMLDKARRVFDLLSTIKEEISHLSDIASGEIRIVAIYTVLQGFLAEKAMPFTERFPHVRFCILAEASMYAMLDMVRKDVCDMAILAVGKLPAGLTHIPLFQTELSLVTPKTGPYAVSSLDSLEAIAALPCIHTMHTTSLQGFLESEFERYGLTMNKAHLISHYEGAKAYVSRGYGVTYIDSFACYKEDYEKFNIISMYPLFGKRTMSAVIRSDRFIPSYQRAFLDFMSSDYKASAC